MPRRRTASDQVSAALLRAAETVLDRDGVAAVTVRSVAQEAGVAPMGVYNRFTNKDGLLTALALRAFDGLAAAIEVDPFGGTPADRLRRSAQGYRRFALAHPARYALIFAAGSPAADPASPVTARGREVFGILVGLVAHLPLRRGLDPVEAAQAFWNAQHGAVTLETAGLGQTPDTADIFERTIDIVMRGLQT
ncbi:TetR/AcrR family transcriptional regulator [Mycolicibacterium sp. 018/SC-01/001]|uniref:TetR/AcrR family transcriptional regulator n=1 Tax=Mycolicibacterium sp. 018/SC-01/001 TaxID=2592069 RepID=UPI0021041DE6|nr:TetR/AcrR family transcriptional regulator [Mycolicibacterium sp. 018/SC-01/001]